MKGKGVFRTGAHIAWQLLVVTHAIVAFAWTVVFATLGFARRSTLVLYDLGKARRRLSGGTLTCPRGHAIVTEGADVAFCCTKCGFVYAGGSAWICGNPECQAITPYINCECGLSVRNPYRWGRP